MPRRCPRITSTEIGAQVVVEFEAPVRRALLEDCFKPLAGHAIFGQTRMASIAMAWKPGAKELYT